MKNILGSRGRILADSGRGRRITVLVAPLLIIAMILTAVLSVIPAFTDGVLPLCGFEEHTTGRNAASRN